MSKFHLKDDGTPGLCSASEGKCPKGKKSPHFERISDAWVYIEQKLSKDEKSFPNLKKYKPELPKTIDEDLARLVNEIKPVNVCQLSNCGKLHDRFTIVYSDHLKKSGKLKLTGDWARATKTINEKMSIAESNKIKKSREKVLAKATAVLNDLMETGYFGNALKSQTRRLYVGVDHEDLIVTGNFIESSYDGGSGHNGGPHAKGVRILFDLEDFSNGTEFLKPIKVNKYSY